ncbi:MAG: LysM peptidoglycan-binding domain-containing protein [Gammaproteobacteria bacterium]
MPRLSCAAAAGLACRLMSLSALLWLSPVQAAEVTIRENSPAQYTVVEGDTLWDIAGMFLEEPWMWPEVWEMNPQIEDPDLIYPGDVIELAYVDGRPVLRLSRGDAPAGIRTVRLSPQIRREPVVGPIPAIPLDVISAYLRGDSILSEDAFSAAPYVLGDREGRQMLTAGDELLARGPWSEGVALYDIVRKGIEIEDPDGDESLGIQTTLVGTATLNRADFDQASLTITSNEQEIRPGDRLIPSQPSLLDASLLPTPPAFPVNAAIAGIQNGRQVAGMYDTLTLNVGANDGIAVGQLLTVQKPDTAIDDQYTPRSGWQKMKDYFRPGNETEVTFSGEKIASVLVYRVFDEASFGLILDSDRDVRLNDRVVKPD